MMHWKKNLYESILKGSDGTVQYSEFLSSWYSKKKKTFHELDLFPFSDQKVEGI